MGKGFAGYKGDSPRFLSLESTGIYNIDKIHDLSLSGDWPYNLQVSFDVYYLVIGGGGGIGTRIEGKGGGGGGGMLTNYGGTALNIESGQSYNIVIGAGGAAGSNGSNSRFYGVDSGGSSFDITALGGGHGNGGSGGSGGGGCGSETTANGGAGAQSGGSGTSGQGNSGGAGGQAPLGGTETQQYFCGIFGGGYCVYDVPGAGGGGGGAGAAGTAGTADTTPGPGGDGLASSITGTSVTYAGGAGGQGPSGYAANGAGADNYGGGNGQDGVVILRAPDSLTVSNPDRNLTYTVSTDGSFNLYSIIAGSGVLIFN